MRLLAALLLGAALSVPLLTPVPARAGAGLPAPCPLGSSVVVLSRLEDYPGLYRLAQAADVNENQVVCGRLIPAGPRVVPPYFDDTPGE